MTDAGSRGYRCVIFGIIVAVSATILVVRDTTVLSAAGLQPLDEVVLRCIVGPRPHQQVLTIRVIGVYPVGG
jgi:hypothetical protein